jgi:Uma2 family endonuclease
MEFYAWARTQPRGRFERAGGLVVAMSPEQYGHTRVKYCVTKALEAALAAVGSSCVAVPEGATVEIDEDTDYEPDASIHCGGPIPRESLMVPNPVVVVEVISLSSRRIDTQVKRDMYFRVPSIQHYLVVQADRREVTHYGRGEGDRARLAGVLTGGRVTLEPPGITVAVEDFYT